MESYRLINITNFIKTKKYFNHFLSIFAFFSTYWHTFFSTINILGITQYKLEKRILFFIWIFCVISTILYKKIGKICSKITMVEVQTWTPLENSTMWQHFWPPCVLSPRVWSKQTLSNGANIPNFSQITICLRTYVIVNRLCFHFSHNK
jgi:hypothetical protein